ncbi:MAG: cytochrome c biogenesis protein CcsA [Gammaproteobacteria bacterium]|nr:cytochrome c biogenesis protein CcsA [Gammaproteobacteria bacterium]
MPEITVLLGYAAAAILMAGPARRGQTAMTMVAVVVGVGATVAHALLLIDAVAPAHGNLSLPNTLSLTGVMFAALALPFCWQAGLRGLVGVFLALAAVGVVLTRPETAVSSMAPDAPPLWQLVSHALLATLAWSLLAAASALALLTAAKDRYLRHANHTAWAATLPPLESMERLMFMAITAGFALLSLAIFSGLVFVEDLLAQHLTHKTLLTILAWLVFAALLFGRWRLGWRGRRAVNLTLAGFAVLLIGYFGSRLVLEMLGREWG